MTATSPTDREKLDQLLEIEGFPTELDFLEAAITDSLSAGICMNAGCDYTTEVEGDQTEGWCELCETGTVKAGLVLAGVI